MRYWGLETAGETDTGKVREKNEDRFIIRSGASNDGEFCLMAIADGMGGMDDGDKASQTAVDYLSAWWNDHIPDFFTEGGICIPDVAASLKAAFRGINRGIFNLGAQNNKHMGTTLTVAFMFAGRYLIMHAGDSRAYFLKRGLRPNPILLTEDQIWANEMVKRGRLTIAEASVHPDRGKLTNCLGLWEGNDDKTLEYHGELKNGDCILLCTDGFYAYAPERRWRALLNRRRGLQKIADSLIGLTMESEANDNITVALTRAVIRKGGRNP